VELARKPCVGSSATQESNRLPSGKGEQAISKLATAENMAYLHQHRGCFVTVLLRTRSEDKTFRESLREGKAAEQLLGRQAGDLAAGTAKDRKVVLRLPL